MERLTLKKEEERPKDRTICFDIGSMIKLTNRKWGTRHLHIIHSPKAMVQTVATLLLFSETHLLDSFVGCARKKTYCGIAKVVR